MMTSLVSSGVALAFHQLSWYYIIHVCDIAPTVMRHLYTVVWPTTTCSVDWLQRGHVTFITVEWDVTAEGQGQCRGHCDDERFSFNVTTFAHKPFITLSRSMRSPLVSEFTNWQSNNVDDTRLIVTSYTTLWTRKISNFIITFCVSRRRRKMYYGHARLCLSVRSRTPTLLHGPGCNLGRGRGCPSLCTIGPICNRGTSCVAMAT